MDQKTIFTIVLKDGLSEDGKPNFDIGSISKSIFTTGKEFFIPVDDFLFRISMDVIKKVDVKSKVEEKTE